MWVLKGGSILLTGVQPSLLLEAALPLFAVGLLGLDARLAGRRRSLRRAGVLVAYAAQVFAVVAFVAPLAPFIVVAGFGPFMGLVLLGSDLLRARIFPNPWNALPLALGLGGPLLILGGGVLALINERLLEVPMVMVGLAWMLLGYSVVAVKDATARPPAPTG